MFEHRQEQMERMKQEEGLVLVGRDEFDHFFGVAFSESILVGGGLYDFIVAKEG